MDPPNLRREGRYGMPAADQIMFNRYYVLDIHIIFVRQSGPWKSLILIIHEWEVGTNSFQVRSTSENYCNQFGLNRIGGDDYV